MTTTFYERVDQAQLGVQAARRELKNVRATLSEPEDIEAYATARAELTIAYEALSRARAKAASILPEPMS
jgi:hypothetical protein